jgi:hypothetical protein
MPDLQMSPVVLRLALNAGGAGIVVRFWIRQAPWVLSPGWCLAVQIQAHTSSLVTGLNTLKQQ